MNSSVEVDPPAGHDALFTDPHPAQKLGKTSRLVLVLFLLNMTQPNPLKIGVFCCLCL
jgi:hypothetical protein